MGEQSKPVKHLAEVSLLFEQAINKFPNHRKELLDEIGKEMTGDVRREIQTNIHDKNNHITKAQEHYAKTGYVAVRPMATPGEGRGGNRPVTIFQNSGYFHVRSGQFITGKLFYTSSKYRAARIAQNAAKRLEEKLKNDLS